jgi:hypothetical protein
LVQENGRQRSFQAAQKCLIAATRSVDVASAQRLALDDREEHLGQVQLRRRGRVKWSWMRE